jgi:hypothetical protein
MSTPTKSKKFRDLKVKNLCAQNIRSENIETENIRAKNSTAETTTTTNLNVSNIILNGRDITCSLKSSPLEDKNQQLDLLDKNGNPIRNPKVNEVVFNALLCNANAELQALRERFTEGRQYIREFENDHSCSTCGNTGDVELSIYGYITQPLVSIKNCGGTGNTGPNAHHEQLQVVQKMFYNLEVDYDVRVAKSTQPRIVSVLCQLAYIDPQDVTASTGATGLCSIAQGDCGVPNCGPVYVEEIVIGNKQFTPTIDPLYGEMFAGTVPIDSRLVDTAATAMPDPNNTAAVQLVFFVEEGLTIWSAEDARGDDTPSQAKDSKSTTETVPFNPATCSQNETPCYLAGSTISGSCVKKIMPSFNYQVVGDTLTVSFTNTSTLPGFLVKYVWIFGDGTTLESAEKIVKHTYKNLGVYDVFLTAEYKPNTSVCPGRESATEIIRFIQ